MEASMQEDQIQSALSLGREELTSVVRRALGRPRAEPTRWRVEEGGVVVAETTAGVYRVTGTALDGADELEWSAMLKVVSVREADDALPMLADEAHPLYWKREALAYSSGLLDDLPGGLRAALCYGVVEDGPDTIRLWLEEAKDVHGRDGWLPQQYFAAAECLGRFNGAYLVGRPIPSYPWLVSSASPRGLINYNAWSRDVAADQSTWEHPLVREVFPLPVRDRLLRLWDERESLLGPLDGVPHTFCHLDAWRRNMFAQPAGAPHSLVLVDWAFPGRGALGTDPGDLLIESFGLAELGDTEPRVLDEAIFSGYMAGLRQAGWQGDTGVVRFGFAVFCALKFGCYLYWLRDAPYVERYAAWERLFGWPFAGLVQRQAGLLYHVLDMADEAFGMVG